LNSISRGSWKNFTNSMSQTEIDSFLVDHTSREQAARKEVIRQIIAISKEQNVRVLELGCGNGERYDTIKKFGFPIEWTGIDIAPSLIDAARMKHPEMSWLVGDCEFPTVVLGDSSAGAFDVALYCHVMEILASPAESLKSVRKIAKKVIVEFFEPPSSKTHRTEIRIFKGTDLPYLRHQFNISTWELWCAEAGFNKIEIFRTFGKYEVHVVS